MPRGLTPNSPREDAEPVDIAQFAADRGLDRRDTSARHENAVIAASRSTAAPARRLSGARPRQPPRAGVQQPDRQCALLRAGGWRARSGCAARRAGRSSHGGGRWTGHPRPTTSSASSSASTPTAPNGGVRPEFRPRPVDLPPDRRGPSRDASAPRTAPDRRTTRVGQHARRPLRHGLPEAGENACGWDGQTPQPAWNAITIGPDRQHPDPMAKAVTGKSALATRVDRGRGR